MNKSRTFTVVMKNGTHDVAYEREFSMYGETFVIHRVIDSEGRLKEVYKASHKETGFGIPNVYQKTVAAAAEQCKAVLDKYGRKRVLDVIAKARESRAL